MPLPNPGVVLVVDDDEDDQFMIHQVLKQYVSEDQIHVLSNGEELLDKLQQLSEPPRLVLLDLNMPLMGGMEALRAIRQQARYEQLPIIILTTSSSTEDQRKANELRATDYLVKPYTVSGLDRILSKVVNNWP